MTPEWTDVDLPGVTPSRQKRSRETTAALLKAGADMLKGRSLDELSIEDLCAEVDATVGAFYSRFDSKEVYFGALLTLAARDGEALVDEDGDEIGLGATGDVVIPVRERRDRAADRPRELELPTHGHELVVHRDHDRRRHVDGVDPAARREPAELGGRLDDGARVGACQLVEHPPAVGRGREARRDE